ncbi:Rdx family domain-containing protein [Trichoderma austrokoningii]
MSSTPLAQPHQQGAVLSPLPRITIQFCTQCKWMLRAAYYAQELLSTFSLSLGEVALQPSTGGTFIVTIYHSSAESSSSSSDPPSVQSTVLWNRKIDEGFPETKELKRRVRDVIEPGRDLGHVDRDHRRPGAAAAAATADTEPIKTAVVEANAKREEVEKKQEPAASGAGAVCEDCN